MKPVGKSKMQRTVLTGVFAALLAVLSQIAIPLPTGVPITLQTFAVALCGYVLGPGMGALSVGVYLALGAVGLPVFAGFSGGVGAFVGMTGGYLWAFLPMAYLCGLGAAQGKKLVALALSVAGLAVCHVCGAVQFALVQSVSPLQAFLIASLPYLLKDVVSVVAAYGAARAILFSLKKAKLGNAL